tara:strand:+ start:40494 stop:40826 length:333 start_codon:yes stop_codon:yes gene_type:complete
MESRFFSYGDILFQEGDKPSAAYIIKEGKIMLSKKTRHGMSKEIAVIEAGNIIGEVSLITNSPHSVTAVAHGDGQAMILAREDFDERLARTDKVITMILQSVIRRLKSTY